MSTKDRTQLPVTRGTLCLTEMATAQAALDAAKARLMHHPDYRAVVKAQAELDRLKDRYREELASTKGVVKSSSGKIGYQVSHVIEIGVKAVEDLIPALRPRVVKETVDKTALKKIVDGLVKTKTLPEDIMDQLEGHSSTKVTERYSFIFEPPASTPERALAEPPLLPTPIVTTEVPW